MKKTLNKNTIIIIIVLSLVTGALFSMSAGGFSTVQGLSTFFIASLVAWVVYALIARFAIKP
jgi:hypothetical protein